MVEDQTQRSVCIPGTSQTKRFHAFSHGSYFTGKKRRLTSSSNSSTRHCKDRKAFQKISYNHRPPRHSILTGSGKGYSSSSVTLAYWARRAAFLCLSSWEISFGFTTILACFSIMLAIAWISSGKKSQSISQSLQMQATKTQLLPPAAPACASAGPQRPRPTTRAKHVALLNAKPPGQSHWSSGSAQQGGAPLSTQHCPGTVLPGVRGAS